MNFERRPGVTTDEHTGEVKIMWFERGFLFGGFMLMCWATLAIVVAALHHVVDLFALVPLLMMMSGMGMMGTMARSAGGDPGIGPWGWCAAWFTSGRSERLEMNVASIVPLADSWGYARRFQQVVDAPDDAADAALLDGDRPRHRLDRARWIRRLAGGPKETPTEILEQRFAEGAISAEEYQERRKVIAHPSR